MFTFEIYRCFRYNVADCMKYYDFRSCHFLLLVAVAIQLRSYYRPMLS